MFPGRRKLRDVLDKGGLVFYVTIESRSPVVVEKLKDVPIDFIYIDMEHSPINWETLENMVRAADLIDLPVLVRIEEEGFFDQIRKCLDLGAQGIVVPHVDSRSQVEEAVRAAKFPPAGARGIGDARPFYISPNPEQSNRDTIIYLLIEDPRGVDGIHEILSVKGVDIIGVARNDFALSAGCPGQLNHPIVEKAVLRVIAHAKKTGVAPMVQLWATERSKVKRFMDAGARVISLGDDLALLKQKCVEAVEEAKKIAYSAPM